MASQFDAVWVPVLQGAFLTAYEGTVDEQWTTPIIKKYDSPNEFLKLIDVGTVGAVAQINNNAVATTPKPYTQLVQNAVFKLDMEIDAEDVSRDHIGMFESKAAEMGAKFADHISKLSAAIIVANPTCMDGTAFYGGSHYISGNVNDVTTSQIAALSTVSGNGNPTAVEAMAIVLQIVTWFYTFKDEVGDPINGGARKFMFLTSNPTAYAAILTAIGSLQLAGGQTDILSRLNAKGYSFDIALEPRLGTSASQYLYVFRTDSQIMPMVWSEEKGVELTYLGEGSYNYVKQNKYIWSAKAVRQVSTGRYQHALRATIA
jgi:hypothetical protein